MITLRKKPYVDTLSVTDMMTFDTKANVRLDAIYIERVIFALKSSKGLVISRKKHIFVPSYI